MPDNKDQKQEVAKEETTAIGKKKPPEALKKEKPKPETLSKTDWFFTDDLREESGESG